MINGHNLGTGENGEGDFGMRAQRAAEEHLEACMMVLWAQDQAPEGMPIPESPASAPFCGCDTCVVREVLHAAWTILERATLGAD